jgi:hypothetical protein
MTRPFRANTVIGFMAAAALACGCALVLSSGDVAKARPATPKIVAQGPAGATRFRRMGMTFVQQAAPASAVSEASAIATAEGYEPATSSGQLLPGVTVKASYGIWSSGITSLDANGNQVLTYQKVPVWIVSFSGSGFAVGTPSGAAGHEESVVVNASTGHALISFT